MTSGTKSCTLNPGDLIPASFDVYTTVPPSAAKRWEESSVNAFTIEQAARLSIKRWCTGKLRVSLAPVLPPFRRRSSMQVFRYAHLVTPIETKEQRIYRKYRADMRLGAGALDSSRKFQAKYQRTCGWGRLASRRIFTGYGANTVQECCWIAKRKYAQKGWVATLTTPGVKQYQKDTVWAWSGWIDNRLKQKLRDNFQSEYSFVFVWENTADGAPHIHCYFNCVSEEELLVFRTNIKQWWFDILRDLTKKTRVDLFARFVIKSGTESRYSWCPTANELQADVQEISKDIAKYLAKYISKGGRDSANCGARCPARWWSVDNRTRREARQERLRLSIGGFNLSEAKLLLADAWRSIEAKASRQFSWSNPVLRQAIGVTAFFEEGLELTALEALEKWFADKGCAIVKEAG